MNQRMLQHIAVSLTAAVMVTLAAALPATAQSKPELQKVHIGVGGKAALYYLPLTITEQLGYFRGEQLCRKSSGCGVVEIGIPRGIGFKDSIHDGE